MVPQGLYDSIPQFTPLRAGTQVLQPLGEGIFRFKGINISELPEFEWNTLFSIVSGEQEAEARASITGRNYQITSHSSVPITSGEMSMDPRMIKREDVFDEAETKTVEEDFHYV